MNRTHLSAFLLGLAAMASFPAAAYFNPRLGRFVSRDPLGYVDGGNLYFYCLTFLEFRNSFCR